MPRQYDVFVNPSKSVEDGIPYVVVIQSDLLDGLPARMTIPLDLGCEPSLPSLLF
jgi:toxin CcdB